MQHHNRFADLAAQYDGFIVDLWGVVHDGVSTYPGAVECLTRLRAAYHLDVDEWNGRERLRLLVRHIEAA